MAERIEHVVAGIRASALVAGAGEPVVLVHGLGTSAESWSRNIDELAADFRVWAVDLPGHGHSDKPDEPWSADHLAAWLAAWCRHVGIARAAFVGHSLGGEVCLWLAHSHPELVDRLVLAASTGTARREPLPRRLVRLLRDAVHEPPSFMPTLLRAYVQARPWRMARTIQESESPALRRLLPEIAAPTLVVWGRKDPVIGRAEAGELARRLPRARFAVIEEGAHGLVFGAPTRFNRLVRDFLREKIDGRLASPPGAC